MKRGGQIKRKAKRRTPSQVAASLAWHREVMAQPYTLFAHNEFIATDFQAHHLIPRQTLRRRASALGIPTDELEWDGRIGVKITKRRHERHHSGHEPILWNQLPHDRQHYVQMFAVAYGLEPWLERHMSGYPSG